MRQKKNFKQANEHRDKQTHKWKSIPTGKHWIHDTKILAILPVYEYKMGKNGDMGKLAK